MRGYHVHMEASVGEELPCQHQNSNRADPFAAMRVTDFAFRCLSLVL